MINAGIFNSGLLSRPRPQPGDQYDYTSAPADLVERATRLAEVCEQFGVDLPAAAAAFAGRHPAVVSVVVGLRTAGEVMDLVARWDRGVPPDLWSALAECGLLPAELAS